MRIALTASAVGLCLVAGSVRAVPPGNDAVATRLIKTGPHESDFVRVPTGPLETPVAPPAVVAQEGAGSVSGSPTIVFGRFQSVQVNVNAQGDNVVNDAANEPTLTVDVTDLNKMAIGWRQFDTIANNFREAGRAYTQDGGQTWIFPGVLQDGQFRSDPVMASDANGVFYFSSLSTTISVEVFKSIDGGVNWTGPVSAFGGDKQWLTVDQTAGPGSGYLYQIWNVQFSCCSPADFTRSIDGAASFQGPYALPEPSMKWGTLSVGPNGDLYSAGTTLNQTGHLFARSSDAQNGAVAPTWTVTNINLGGTPGFASGPNPGGLLGQTQVAADHSNGNIYVLQSVNPPGPDPLEVHFIRSVDGGVNWSAPIRVNDDPAATNAWQWFATMSVAPNGRIDVIWNDTRNAANPNVPATTQVFYSHSLDGGLTWSVNEPMTPAWNHSLGYPQQNKIGDYYHMVSFNDEAMLAYAATFNGEQDVWFVRFTPFCKTICDSASPPGPEINGVAKNRYLSVTPDNPGQMTALRVTLSDLPSPFDAFDGNVRWVGAPQVFQETPGPTFFRGAPLVCAPVFRDWGSEGLIHVYGDAVVPEGEYTVQAIAQGCDTEDECNYSAALSLTNQKWGDVVVPFASEGATGQPNFLDISAVADKFRDAPGAVIKARADLQPDTPNQNVNFADISVDADAFRGTMYPFDGPSGCP